MAYTTTTLNAIIVNPDPARPPRRPALDYADPRTVRILYRAGSDHEAAELVGEWSAVAAVVVRLAPFHDNIATHRKTIEPLGLDLRDAYDSAGQPTGKLVETAQGVFGPEADVEVA